jgi:hypothetical protein
MPKKVEVVPTVETLASRSSDKPNRPIDPPSIRFQADAPDLALFDEILRTKGWYRDPRTGCVVLSPEVFEALVRCLNEVLKFMSKTWKDWKIATFGE